MKLITFSVDSAFPMYRTSEGLLALNVSDWFEEKLVGEAGEGQSICCQ